MKQDSVFHGVELLLNYYLSLFMTKKFFAGSMLALLACVSLASCTTGGGEEVQYVKIGQNLCSFLAEGNQPLEIDVKASPAEWTVEAGATWVKAERTADRTLTVTVEDNDTGSERSAVLTVTAGQAVQEIGIRQLAADGAFARFRKLDTFSMGAAMSPSGRYVGGFYTDVLGENEFQYTAVVIDLETDKWHEFGPYPETLFGFTEAEVVTDQGVLYISDSTNGGCVAFDLDGTYTVPKSVAGYGPLVMQSSSVDGSVMVGYTEGTPYGCMYGPVKVVDGEVKPLPLPEEGNFRNEEWWAGILARGMSADGSVVYGTSWENYDYGMAYWDKDGNVDWVGSDLRTVTTVQRPNPLDGTLYDYNIVNGMICWANQTQISPNGTWIAGTYRTEEYDKENDEVLQANYPAFFNTETKTTTVFDEYAGCVAMGVTDDGLGLIGIQGMGVNSGFIVDLASKTKVDDMLPWIRSEFGIIISEGAIHYLTPDRQKVFGAKLRYEQNGAVTTLYWYVAPALNN